MANLLYNLVNRQKGQGLVEYALILVLISIAVIALMTALGTEVGTVFEEVTNELSGA
jgi:pilus assembly protein Flp/PilA